MLSILKSKNYNAFACGFFAALSSCFGKLSSLIEENLFITAICIILMIISNTLVWTFFVKALQNSSSLNATITSASTNYCLSAFLGCLIFGETTTFYWWFGTSLVLAGLFLISFDTTEIITKNKKTE